METFAAFEFQRINLLNFFPAGISLQNLNFFFHMHLIFMYMNLLRKPVVMIHRHAPEM